MSGFRTLTPEQRRENGRKGAATAAANREKRAAALLLSPTPDIPAEVEVAKPTKLPTPVEDNYDEFDGLLTDVEKAEIEAAARKRAREDKRKAIKAAYAKEMLDKARRELGEMPADEAHRQWIEEEMRIYVDLPRLRKPTGGEHDPDPIIIDQTVYHAGRFYDVPRGRAIYLLYLMDQLRRHINQVDGRSRTYYNPAQGQMIYQGGPALGGGSLGPGFDALHKRRA